MSQPDPELLRLYGTVKEAGDLSTAVRIATAILGLGLMSHDQDHVEDQKREQVQEHTETREDEAARMQSMESAMKTASVIGQRLARVAPPLQKQAFGALGRIGKALTPGWKTKALGLGAVGAAGYVGYKGMSALRDYADEERGDQRWGAKRPLKQNVNEFGTSVD